eukprot:15835-Heterococcus_DN1.PRE.2
MALFNSSRLLRLVALCKGSTSTSTLQQQESTMSLCNPVAAQWLCYAYFKHASCAKRKQAAMKLWHETPFEVLTHLLQLARFAAMQIPDTQLGYKGKAAPVSERRLLSCEQKSDQPGNPVINNLINQQRAKSTSIHQSAEAVRALLLHLRYCSVCGTYHLQADELKQL